MQVAPHLPDSHDAVVLKDTINAFKKYNKVQSQANLHFK